MAALLCIYMLSVKVLIVSFLQFWNGVSFVFLRSLQRRHELSHQCKCVNGHKPSFVLVWCIISLWLGFCLGGVAGIQLITILQPLQWSWEGASLLCMYFMHLEEANGHVPKEELFLWAIRLCTKSCVHIPACFQFVLTSVSSVSCHQSCFGFSWTAPQMGRGQCLVKGLHFLAFLFLDVVLTLLDGD